MVKRLIISYDELNVTAIISDTEVYRLNFNTHEEIVAFCTKIDRNHNLLEVLYSMYEVENELECV